MILGELELSILFYFESYKVAQPGVTVAAYCPLDLNQTGREEKRHKFKFTAFQKHAQQMVQAMAPGELYSITQVKSKGYNDYFLCTYKTIIQRVDISNFENNPPYLT